ncbi:General secretion pathway protein D / Type II secretion outermembrane pore forming protein (PulD) [hydrothermal vent metagenome]|uniref:General secretion pathway protein D / Type II secretion outermembrane pore forming protein (PulD) n=1 Tax=hydrothermal vent metagenome TaxID=652676 RepID=A0A1W1EBF1_9ZZZZ
MKLTKIILSTLLIWTIGVSGQENFIHENTAQEETVDVNFRDLSVHDFVEMVAKITHKNILIEGDLKGKINFVSQAPIKKSSLMALANSILGSKGYTIIDQGDFYKVVKGSTAAGEGLDVSSTVDGETMKTVMFPLKNSNAAVIRAKIKPLLRKDSKVISFKENNVLAITATPRTLQSISKIINAVEERGVKRSVVVKLKHSSIKDLYPNATSMAKKLFPQTIESEKVDIFKDEATNSVILVGKADNIRRMIRYIKKLDIQGEDQTQKMYVIRLKNSNVEEMEKILSKLVAQLNNVAIKQPKKGGPAPTKAMVVSDVERNALIILATGEQIKNIRQTVRQIDIPKVQVYVKAKIVEINSNLAQQVGLKYGMNGGTITSNGLFTMGANLGANALQMSPGLLGFLNQNTEEYKGQDANGNPIYVSNPAFKFDSTDKVFALGAALDLLHRNGAANILSEPSVLCTNNKEAEIYVGQTMSILTQAQQSTTGVSNVVNNYSREDIGITLKVKPRLSSNNQVTLEVETTIEDIDPSSEQAADRPTTTKRKVTTNAIVQNGEMIILGGLIKNAGGKGVQKVPFLGDIPVLGEMLFTHTSDVNREANVVIYLTPYIVRKSGDLKKLRSMLSELEEVQGRYNTYVRNTLEAKKDNKPFAAKKSCSTKRTVNSSSTSIYNSINTHSNKKLRSINVEDF